VGALVVLAAIILLGLLGRRHTPSEVPGAVSGMANRGVNAAKKGVEGAGQEAQKALPSGEQGQPSGEQGQPSGEQAQPGQQQPQPGEQQQATGGVAAPQTLSASTFAAPLAGFLSGTAPTPARFVLEDLSFAPDSSEVNQNPMLDAVAAQLNKFQTAKIRIDGYTDSTGTTAGNADLSTARANAVKRYLTAHGVDDARIEVQGRAAEQPVASNDTAQGRAENRRVELVVTSR
jgi:outer membrane protein OmpA-like peptidoglycan-associated protein